MVGSPEIGSLVRFGRWCNEDIEWRVLDAEPNRTLLITDKAIDCRQYHCAYEPITWSECSLRAWLNGEFLQGAFSPSERARILEARVVNDDNPDFGIKGGPNTLDNVFCLSIDEARIYFENMRERICCPTPHAKERGIWTNEAGACDWWLRSPGGWATAAAEVDRDGAVCTTGEGVAGGLDGEDNIVAIETAVRPALWIAVMKDESKLP